MATPLAQQPLVTTAMDQGTQTVLLAVHTLLHDMDKDAKARANEWLSEFQHSNEAWQACHSILTSPSTPFEARLVSSQTLRQKVLYDLSQLPPASLGPLRDSFLSLLTSYSAPEAPAGSKAIVVQLCLVLADLAYYMPEWTGVVEGMVETYGKDPARVSVLLEFLRVLVEESVNPRMSVPSNQMAERCQLLLTDQSERVLEILSMYIGAQGVTTQIQTAVFETLQSWLREGEMSAIAVSRTPLFGFAFNALQDETLFDVAVDVICDMIHETQEVEDNVEVIQQLVPAVIALRSKFDQARNDEVDDIVRGYARIFTEAGETYRQLIMQHPETFLPLVQVIGECAAYHDLDIVPITFNFWYKLAQTLGKRPEEDGSKSSAYMPFLQIYANLQDAMIKHLRFPSDGETQTAEERDEFRSFRHLIGDTLKDCCLVLGASVCMQRSFDLLRVALSKGDAYVWQDIEAPLFSMRSMGAQVDPNDDEILPHIMDILPTLPRHPKIQYAAILVISRYTAWIDQHPSYIEFQLNYISAGFEVAQDDVSAAAAQAMRYMCQDCRQHLVPYLPQLYSFITTAGLTLPIEDRIGVTEAIGWVISSMKSDEAAQALQKFTQPLLEQVQALASRPGMASKRDMEPVLEALEQLESYLAIVRSIDPFPESCANTPAAVYEIFDSLLARYFTSYSVTDRVSRVLRRAMMFFPYSNIAPILPSLLERMTSSFEGSGHASYIWIIGKTVGMFGEQAGSQELASALQACLERSTAAVQQIEAAQTAREIPDVIDDFVHALSQYLKYCPQILLPSPALPTAFEITTAALTLPAPDSILMGLETIEDILKATSNRPEAQQAVQGLALQHGARISALCLQGLVTNFPEDSLEPIVQIVRDFCRMCPREAQQWVALALNGLPGHVLPSVDKQTMLTTFEQAFATGNPDSVKAAIVTFLRSARRAKERKERMSVGGKGSSGR